MHNFNTPLTCTECDSHDRYQIFADLDGNGIKCLDCLHKHYVFKPTDGEKPGAKRQRLKSAWDDMRNEKEF